MNKETLWMTPECWVSEYRKIKKEFWRTVAAIAILLFLVVWHIPYGGAGADGDATVQTDGGVDFIEQGCRDYERTFHRKIYPSGREFIRNGAIRDGLTTSAEVVRLIEQNEKFMWTETPASVKLNFKKQ